MERAKNTFYHNIIGDTKDTINAIQKFLEKNSPVRTDEISEENLNPAGSVVRVIDSVADEDIISDIQKIIKNL